MGENRKSGLFFEQSALDGKNPVKKKQQGNHGIGEGSLSHSHAHKIGADAAEQSAQEKETYAFQQRLAWSRVKPVLPLLELLIIQCV